MSNRTFRRALALTTAITAISAAPQAMAGTIDGSVVDATGTRALQAAEVTIIELGRTTHAARDGSFRFIDVPAGSYTLEVRYVGAATETMAVTVSATGSVTQQIALGASDSSILVIGQLANQASALSRKKAADVVSDVLTRDAIGQFPDQNVAESLRRLPGINVLNDQGEGRFVSVRGLDPELNSTSLNGVRLPAPESDVRSVALDVISSDIIESITVKKSLTPDMDGDTIGGSVEIETTSAFDRKKDLWSARIEGSYNDYANVVTPKMSFDFATKLSDDLGISGGVSYYKRKFETDNIEADDWVQEGGIPYATEVQYRDYDVERERISATLGLDFRASDTTELYVKGVFSQFDDQEYRRRLTFDLGDFEDGDVSYDGQTVTYSDADQEWTAERDIKDRFERQRIWNVVAGGKTELDSGWFAEYSASYAKASEQENGSLDPTQFEQSFDNQNVGVAIDYSDPRVPLFSIVGDSYAFRDDTAYGLKDIEYVTGSDAQDEEYAATFDLGREFAMDASSLTLQAGFKGRWRDKTYDKSVEFYENDDMTLADVLGASTYRLISIDPVPSYDGATDYFRDNFDSFELQQADSQFDSAVEDYTASEDIMAGYLMGTFETGPLTAIGGVRYEHTKNRTTGNAAMLYEEGSTLGTDCANAGVVADDDLVCVGTYDFSRSYGHWLPSLNLKYELSPEMLVRLAGYRSIMRPKLSALAPRFEVEVNDEDEIEGTFGNPYLKPYESWNLDASVEYYMSSNGGISAGVFYKDIDNFIYEAEYNAEDGPYFGSYRGIDFDEAVIYENGLSASVFGVELSASQVLDFLPGLLSGFLVQANYTYTDATGDVAVDGSLAETREISLPASSKHTVNGVLGYEKGPVSLRLAGTWRSKYLDEVNGEAAEDRWVDDHFQLDLSAKYRLTEAVQLYYEWVNINNAKYFAYNTMGGQRNLYQYEEYNWTMKFGARVKF
ncbi:TonB-dependent receptor [Croceicoccus mobilis]|uniref:TonB-dependent receptor n=1 Tax=Croceicoccus mobilis TaxID=1703339 RepID=A0A916Z4M2_9SPHN|nr:TonB-dependent receptor [Croceicoccus mobilis]GGD73485.1 TonB-dependent receptor [Croceicoccus mobilis]